MAFVLKATGDQSAVGKTYELCGPSEFAFGELLDYMAMIARRPSRHYWVPEFAYRFAASMLERVPIYTPVCTVDQVIRRSLDETRTVGLPGFEDLGMQPRLFEQLAIMFLRSFRPPALYSSLPEDTEQHTQRHRSLARS